MQFPMRDTMTADHVVANNAAQQKLVRGKYYRFDPPVKATAVPTGGPNTCALKECEFDRGWYIGLTDGNHVFHGKPVNDQRVILTPQGYEDAPNLDEIKEALRDSYFHALFIGGSQAVLDADQSHR
ncbi:hypothetical protein A3B21_04900 [Candidatus Uhrbacteria bacterium RIFCSPLOWO2_01_FULL_47_24]|uniref:Uncharacterized protein n=1 Tax=Candidatus Uhrbacteria bacterium RIFCSPLOWO2_01_FULL_47_24 TaxID=1802401 RepID=A0A1F7UWL0_9BACT|nr:MAG: hypothetical protein A3D58_03285 [Candidatus Uhrbacteria bacterium RIFCSPHIGHO2_02_FULL_46_47]OGL69293.1 MAG: hypothetical protein A3D58_03295 [Candidatus Uhrbacteria bacterium RIFCSPHIGHO2_02_FULL_46_47]OGL76364.1 MAG: hypothetical protein A3F52_00585 [Candidatus Uhrbacteria bacterium RIFCSPHIGHO2_12_FULL_47_11]OGL82027.1 MAG: hypothetical protein A3B21_04900 [Candidatus Uhrbacteria bacterium RIFCSPLOWO2_01_FULL_47_24]OGL85421.1 MAG: hypothetical protein A3J03_05065 [Candidatus Uhrbact